MSSHTGDLCATKACHDLAHPGHDYCLACIADRQAERDIVARHAAQVTADHEAAALEDDA